MQLITQGCEIMSISHPQPLLFLEECARTCYKSEDAITDGSADRLIRGLIKRGHHSQLEHVSMTVRFITNRGVTHEMVRHRLAAYCLSGDSVILRYNNNRGHLTIADLYDRQQDGQLRGRNKLMLVRSMNEDGVIVPNSFKEVVDSGEKDMYQVRTALGYSIKASLDHVFFTPAGELQLRNLNVGDEVYVNGIELVVADIIQSIEYVGPERSFDLVMREPFHNFVASGFVVHNSQESTRYVNYDSESMKFIMPVWWGASNDAQRMVFNNSMRRAEQEYKELRRLGWKAQQAREVLPNAVKTEIVMTCNLREARHILDLRCSSAAHPQMVGLMTQLREMAQRAIPVVFE